MNTQEKTGLAAIAAALETSTALPAAVAAAAAEPARAESVDVAKPDATAKPAPTAAAGDAVAERARIGAIINAPEASGREKLANHLAFETTMSAEQAVAVLKASPVAAPAKTESGLAAAMAKFAPHVDPEEGPADSAKERAAGLTGAVDRQLSRLGLKARELH